MANDTRARNIVIKLLGAFWILDGLLQFQPKMFAPDFVSDVLAPNLPGQPAILHALVAFGIAVWNAHPILNNLIAAVLQIAIGVLLIWPSSKKASDRNILDTKLKVGLYLSIVWGMIVWIFGEGAGGLFNGTASFLTGAPGSVLIYVLLAIFLLMPEKISVASYSKILGIILIVCALLQFQPIYLFLITVAIGLVLVLKSNRAVGVITLIFLLAVWWLGQDFGGLSTLFVGTATDPNTAPILALFLVLLFMLNSTSWKKTKR